MNIFKSVVENIEKSSDVKVMILADSFHIDADPEEKIEGFLIQIWSKVDEENPIGRLLRQIVFDLKGNPYCFACSGKLTYFRHAPMDGHHYDGFTPCETIELVRFRNYILGNSN